MVSDAIVTRIYYWYLLSVLYLLPLAVYVVFSLPYIVNYIPILDFGAHTPNTLLKTDLRNLC